MRISRLSAVSAALFALAVFTPAASAQVLYGSLVGSITDQSGASVPRATVTILNLSTGASREAATDPEGRYSIQNIQAGTYEIKVSASGFRTAAKSGIAVTINVVTRFEVALELGQVNEQVRVEAQASTLQTDKADVHVEIGEREVRNLPLPKYRNYQSLINLVPGATPGAFQNSPGSTPGRALTTNVNGTNRNNNMTKLDGAVNVNIWLPHHTAYTAPAETIETVNITTNNFDAEQGMAGGAAITVVTKSGTNDLHGSAFLFHDNSLFAAKNFFFRNPKTPKGLITIPGFTVGGPIKKNKLFYFGGWESTRERLSRNQLFTVPTEPERQGDYNGLATIYDPATGSSDGSGRIPFTGGRIPANRQSAITRKLLGLVPLPNQPGVTANYFASGGQNMDRDNYDVKINYNKSDRVSFFGKYSIMNANVTGDSGLGAAGGPCICDGGIGPSSVRAQLSTIGYTWTVTPTLLWDGLAGWTRTGSRNLPPLYGTNFGLDTLGIPGTNGTDIRESGMPNFAISGYTNLGNAVNSNPSFYGDTSYTTSHNIGWIKGSHNIRFGFEGVRHWLNHWQPERGAPRGSFTFNQTVTGLRGASTNQFNAMAGFLLGLPQTVGKSIQWSKLTGFNTQLGGYFRDRWQVNRNLTVSLGVRYEYYPMMTRAGRGGIEQWDETTNMVLLGGAGGNPKDLGISTSKLLFAPRVGIALRLGPSTVLRTGYGMTYNPMPLARPLRDPYPLTIAQDFTSLNSYLPFAPIEQGIPLFSGPDLSLGSVPLPATALMKTPTGDELVRGYIQSWNFFLERTLPLGMVTSVGYVGTQTVNGFGWYNANAAAPGTGTAGRTFYPLFGRTADTNYWNGQYSAHYHGLQVAFSRPFAHGFMLKGAYTYSNAINMMDDDGNANLIFNWAPIVYRNRSQAGYNLPHMFQIGYLYELPFGKGKPFASEGVLAKLFGGWQMNGTFGATQGAPFTVTADAGALNAPGNTQTADQVKSTVDKVGSVDEFYDRTAFAPVNSARFGNTGRNLLRGPGVVNMNLGLFRQFTIMERIRLQFRAESFNFTNTPHFAAPNANVSSASFMRITAADTDQRTFRFGLRAEW